MSVLDRLEALLAQATPPPWRQESGGSAQSSVNASADLIKGAKSRTIAMTGQTRGALGWEESMRRADADAALICGAVNALPALIACARALEFYADEKSYTQLASWGGRLLDPEGPWSNDCGIRAREALARLAEGEPQP